MRAVITRVKSASVSIAGSVVGEIGHGLLILLGVGPDDTPELCEKLADKALGLRIFCDEAGKMNRSFADILTGIILFFIIGCEFFISYKLQFRKKAEKEVQ